MSFTHYLIFYCVTLIDTSSLTGIDLSHSINNSISMDKVDQSTNATTIIETNTTEASTLTTTATTTSTFESTSKTLEIPRKNESLVLSEIIESNSTSNESEVWTQNSTSYNDLLVEQNQPTTLSPLEYSTTLNSILTVFNNNSIASERTTLETTPSTSTSLQKENSSLSNVTNETLAARNETKSSQEDRVKSELQVQSEGEEDEDGESDVYLVSNRRQCQPSQSNSIDWETVDASVTASKPCPSPYTGTAYRACYSMGHWEEPDLTECRLPHLREIQNLIFYHVHKHLVDGLYPLAEELNRLLQSPALPIHSPMDKLDALDSLNSILKTKLRIKLDNEDRDVPFVKSLISSSEQLLTQLPLAFPLETEKNALLTMKSVETIFGLKSLSESLLRALIVFCNDGTIRQIKSFNPITTNIALTLTHVTPFGDRISLLHSEDDSNEIEHSPSKPKANIFLEDFRRYGMGISEIYLKNVNKDFDSDSMSLVSDIIVISVVPPISIEANFERVPQIEIDFALHQTATYQEKLVCGKLKSPRELWSHKECQIVFRNLTFIRCSCSELGIFGVVQVKSLTSQQHSFNHHNQCHFNALIIYLSSGFSLIFILVTMAGQVVIMVTSPSNRKSCYILLNLLTCLALIEIIFLFGGPFQSSSSSFPASSPSISKSFGSAFIVEAINFVTPCKMISMVLHYLHLVVSFTMLTYSIYLYNKLWHYQDIITPDNNNNEVICYPDNGSLLPITVTNNGQSFSSSESLPATQRQNYYQQYHHQLHHQQQQQQSIQQSQSFSSYSSFPYFFSSPSSPTQSSPSSSSSTCSSSSSSSTSPTSCEKALISWNQPNLHKEPASQRIINLLLFTWIASLLCVITSNIINPLGYETKRYCWMSIEGGMMFSFIVPVSLLIMSNTVTMLLVLKRFFAYKPITHKIEIERVEPSLRSGVSLLPFFAVNWFLSVLALEDTATNIFQYLFSFCNLIQHLLIFLFHCYQRPEIHQIFAIYFYNGNYNRTDKSNLKSKKNYWCSANCATVPLLIYSDDGPNRLPENCFEDPASDMGRLKDQ